MKSIKIFGRASGPNGTWPAGGIMVVGKDLTEESAQHLVDSGQAEWLDAPLVREEEVETTEAAPAPEAAVKAPRKPRRRKAKK
jgi:hypothetical protein